MGTRTIIVDGQPVQADLHHPPRYLNSDFMSQLPNGIRKVLQAFQRYRHARARWIAAGRPLRTSEEIATLFDEHCKGCSHFTGTSCDICSCRIARHGTLLNKLAWPTEQCPYNPPKWHPDPTKIKKHCLTAKDKDEIKQLEIQAKELAQDIQESSLHVKKQDNTPIQNKPVRSGCGRCP